MTAPHDLDRQLSAFLTEGPTELPDQSFDSVRDHIESMRQRAFIGPWRFPDMNKLAAIGLGTAAVVLALVFGSRLLGPTGSTGVGGPHSAAPSAAPTATPSASPRPSVTSAPSSAAGFLPIGEHRIVDVGAIPNSPFLTVSIPASGWAAMPDFGGLIKGPDGDPPESAMLLWSWPVGQKFDVYGDPCKWESTKPKVPATTVDEIVAALRAQALRDASDPVNVTVSGYSGKKITLHVPTDPAASSQCDRDTFGSYGKTGDSEPSRTHQGPGQIDELWVLNVNGAISIIDAMYRADTPADRVEELRTLAESTTYGW
jgi:hypothetical protein